MANCNCKLHKQLLYTISASTIYVYAEAGIDACMISNTKGLPFSIVMNCMAIYGCEATSFLYAKKLEQSPVSERIKTMQDGEQITP